MPCSGQYFIIKLEVFGVSMYCNTLETHVRLISRQFSAVLNKIIFAFLCAAQSHQKTCNRSVSDCVLVLVLLLEVVLLVVVLLSLLLLVLSLLEALLLLCALSLLFVYTNIISWTNTGTNTQHILIAPPACYTHISGFIPLLL